MSKKSNNVKLMLIGGAILASIFIILNLSQEPFQEKDGLIPFFSIPEEFQIFKGLTLVDSTALNCDLTHSMYYTSGSDDKQYLVSANVEDNVVPQLQLNLLSGSTGNEVNEIQGELKTKCPTSTNNFVDPHVSGGIVVITVEATNSDGKVVKIKDIQKSISTTATSVNGKRVTIATWSVTPDEIESKIDEGNGNYVSRVSARVAGTINYKTFKDENANWKYTIKSGLPTDFGFRKLADSSTSIIDNILIKDRQVELKLISPTEGSVNLAKNGRINVVGSLYGWETAEGYPIIRMYYDDPTASSGEKTKILYQKTVTTQSGTIGKDGIADFSLTILPDMSSKTGKYKITFSSAEKNGSPIRSTVASVPVNFIRDDSPTKGGDQGTDNVDDLDNLGEQEKKDLEQACKDATTVERTVDDMSSLIKSISSSQSSQEFMINLMNSGSFFTACKQLGIQPNVIGDIPWDQIITLLLIMAGIVIIYKVATSRKPKYPPYPYGG